MARVDGICDNRCSACSDKEKCRKENLRKITYFHCKDIDCEFCKTIYKNNELENMYWLQREDFVTHSAIVACNDKDNASVRFGLWYECEDDYYSGWFDDIKYCPKCGKKLYGCEQCLKKYMCYGE